MTTVNAGQTLDVSAEQNSNGVIVLGGGTLNVISGGTISDTVDSGGIDNVSSGGTAVGTTLGSGGEQYISIGGMALGATVDAGGAEYVLSGGTASGTTIGSGGYDYVAAGGTADAPTIVGGTLELASGAFASGPISFSTIGGTLQIDGPTMPSAVISGFVAGDTIDLAQIGYDSGGSIALSSQNVVQITESGQTYSLDFDPAQTFAGQSFAVSSNGSGGIELTLVEQPPASAVTTSSGQPEADSASPVVGSDATVGDPSGGFSQPGAKLELPPPNSSVSKLVTASGPFITDVQLANLFAQDLDNPSTGHIDDATFLFQECFGGGMLAQIAQTLDSSPYVTAQGFPEVAWTGGAAAPWYYQALSTSNEFGTKDLSFWTQALLTQIDNGTSNPYHEPKNIFYAIQAANKNDADDPDPQVSDSSTFTGTDNGGADIVFQSMGDTKFVAVLWDSITNPKQAEWGPKYDILAMEATIKSAWGGAGGLDLITLLGKNATYANLQQALNAAGLGPGGDPSGTGFLFYATGHGDDILKAYTSSLVIQPGHSAFEAFDNNNPWTLTSLKSDPVLELQYSGVVASNTVQVLWNNVSLGYLQPGETIEDFNLPAADILTSNDLTVQNTGSATVVVESVSLDADNVSQVIAQTTDAVISAGQVISALALPAGIEVVVLSGGSAGFLDVQGGTLVLSSGAVQTDLSIVTEGGTLTVAAGAASFDTLLSGGSEIVYGTASGTVVDAGGLQTIESGGTATATMVEGGTEYVASGGTALSVVISGGTLELASGASTSGTPITFAVGAEGTLQIDGTAMPSSVISGFVAGDTIDLAGVSFTNSGSATLLSGNVLQVVESSRTYDLNFAPSQDFLSEHFTLSAGTAGTDVGLVQSAVTNVATVASGQVVEDVMLGSACGGATDSLEAQANTPRAMVEVARAARRRGSLLACPPDAFIARGGQPGVLHQVAGYVQRLPRPAPTRTRACPAPTARPAPARGRPAPPGRRRGRPARRTGRARAPA